MSHCGSKHNQPMIQGQAIVKGEAQGEALVTNEPLSFWGGYDYHTGEIIDRRHPLSGQIAAGRVLAVPFTRGSSTTTAVLLEAIKAGTAPAAILTTEVDYFFALASIVADEMYKTALPVVALTASDFARLQTGQWLHVHHDGRIESDSRLTTHDSRLTTHDSRLTTHDSRLTTHDSRLTTHDSRLTTHDSRLTTHDSRLTTHGLTTHDSRLTTHDSRLTTDEPPASVRSE